MIAEKIIIDATNSSLGRLASHAAKQALLGKSITIVNCNNAVISGKKGFILENYKKKRSMKHHGAPALKGPHFPRSPEKIMKRTIRGMLPYKKGHGINAFKRVICYNNTPIEYENSSKLSLQKTFNIKTIKLKELSELI